MLNQVVLVGRLVDEIKVEKIDDDKIMGSIKLAVPRPYKNKEGIYDNDTIEIELYGSIASNTHEYCNKGDIIGIKGRIENGNHIIAEKVTFLSSKKVEEEGGEEDGE